MLFTGNVLYERRNVTMAWVRYRGSLAYLLPVTGVALRWNQRQFETFKRKHLHDAFSIRIPSGRVISAPLCDLEWHGEAR